MTAQATAIKPLRSGFCGLGNPDDSHARCSGSTDGHPCSCACHVEVVDAQILDTPEGVIVTDAGPDTDEWFAARRAGITGTDLPKILGLSKYGNSLSVWMDKRGELDDSAGEAARWGHILEEPVALEWAERQDALVERIGVVRHGERAWIRASLDRRVIACPDGDDVECGLEIKTRSAFKAADWRDGVPDDVLAQTTWGLMATGFDHMHVAALIGGQRLEAFRVERDAVLERYLLEQAEPVWAAVQGGFPPEVSPDAEGVLLDLLDRLYGSRDGERELDAEKAEEWLAMYADGGVMEREAKAIKTTAKTALVQMLDDGDAGLIDDALAFTYRRPDAGYAFTADQLRRLKKERPVIWGALHRHGFITETNPAPRFDVKKRATKEIEIA